MILNALFKESEDGRTRMIGYATCNYSSNDEDEYVRETSEEELADRFREAPADELPNVGIPIEEAVENPLAFTDFLVLNGDDIVFDTEYTREKE